MSAEDIPNENPAAEEKKEPWYAARSRYAREFRSENPVHPETLALLDGWLERKEVVKVCYIGDLQDPILEVLHRHLGWNYDVVDYTSRYSWWMQLVHWADPE